MATNKFPAQAELIERVKAILNLSNEALAVEVAVRPETMQKYAAGYQKAGDKLMRIISRLPEIRQRGGRGSLNGHQRDAGPVSENSTIEVEELPRDMKLDPPCTQEQLGVVLEQGTLDEVRLLRQVIETIFRQIECRRRPLPVPVREPKAVFFDRRPRLLPALGYIPAGWPQQSVEGQADQFVVVPESEFPEAEYVLKVQGDSMIDADIHHGDWVVMTTRRQPRAGNVVAALCDNETTLKTYSTDGGHHPFLRSENRAYPSRIIPHDEMQIQGVMLGKLKMADERTGADHAQNGANGSASSHVLDEAPF